MSSGSGLLSQLKSKSRRRRESFKRQADAEPLNRIARNDIAPGLELVQRTLTDLVIPERNVRALDQHQIRDIATSISNLGFCVPILIDQNNKVLDGISRIEAARSLGLSTIPCIVAGHLNPSEQRLLRLTLNRLQERGSWDLDTLKLEFEELILEEMPIEITGFTGIEVDQILLGDATTEPEDGPLAPPENQPAVARPGDVFILGQHKIICGDATDPSVIAKIMEGETAQLLLTDVPYNVKIVGNVTKRDHREFMMASGEMTDEEFLEFNQNWMRTCAAYLCDGAVLGTFIDWRGYPTVHSAAVALELTPLNLVVWTKTNAGMGSLYRSQHELLPLYRKGDRQHINNVALGKNGRWRSNVWNYPGASTIGSEARRVSNHPTVKPTTMLEDAFLDLTNRNDLVIDPFLGSGSTLIAAEKTGRRCRAIELDPLYVDVAIRRYETMTGKSATFLET